MACYRKDCIENRRKRAALKAGRGTVPAPVTNNNEKKYVTDNKGKVIVSSSNKKGIIR